jgi:hypothetical protein
MFTGATISAAITRSADMPRAPGSARALDLQLLTQAIASTQRAAELFLKGDDREATAQAELAERFLDEFIENRQPKRKAR